jgi:hypothetical protein
MTTSIRDATVSLQNILTQRLGADPDVLASLPPGAALTVSIRSPDEMLSAPEQGISLWLYKITRDEHLTNYPPRRVSASRHRPPPLPLRLHYLLTPVLELDSGLSAPEFEHTVLGKALQLFAEEPVLRGTALVGALRNEASQIAVRLEPLTTEEITRIWDALESNYKLSVSYEVSVVPVDVRSEIISGPPVEIVANSYGTAYVEETP